MLDHRLVAGLIVTAALAGSSPAPALAQAWTPPLGIPAPGFGIVEDAPATPNPWTTGVAGFYYVDATAAGATDTSNPNGYPAKPRKTIPLSLPAGAVVEVHGQYTQSHISPNVIMANGTQASPVFVRGLPGAHPTFIHPVHIHGTYFVVENIDIVLADAGEEAFKILSPTNNGVLRHSDLKGNSTGGGISVAYNSTFGGTVSNVVLWDNDVHDNGDVNSTFDQDSHAITVGSRVSYLFIVDNILRDSSGDGVQVNAGSKAEQAALHHVFLGRNDVHGTRQAGLFTKQATHVVFSQNRIHDIVDTSWSPSKCLGYQYAPEDVWFLYNEVWNATFGIYAGSDSGQGNGLNIYIVGNVIHGIHHIAPFSPDTGWGNAGIMLAGGTNRTIVNNTIYDVDAGIQSPSSTGNMYMTNNIISNVTEPLGHHIFVEDGGTADNSTMHHNLLDGSVRIRWGTSTDYDLAGFQAAFPTQGAGCFNADPLFADPVNADFHLQPASVAIDSGFSDPVYGTYQTLYGIDLVEDLSGSPRPQGTAYDMGAYEGAGTILPRLRIDDVSLPEGDSGTTDAVLTVTLSPASSDVVTVTYDTADGTAKAPADYAPTSGVLTFAPGQTTQTLAVAVNGDTTSEPDEAFFVELLTPTNAVVLDGRGQVTIVNDEPTTVSLAFSAGGYNVSEGNDVTLTVVRSGDSTPAVTVHYATSNGTALAPGDYTTKSGTLSFGAGVTSVTLSVHTVEDSIGELAETFNVTLTSPTGGAVIGTPNLAIVTIADDEAGGQIQFTNGNFSVQEGAGLATISVRRSGTAGGVTVRYATANGSATAGTDYTAKSGTLSFGAGVTLATFTIPITKDTIHELSESVALSLTNPTGGATLGTHHTANLTIFDDDVGGVVNFAAAAYTVSEAAATVALKVTRTGGAASGVTINYATSDGTAKAGLDYTAKSGTLTFGAGATAVTLPITITRDTIDEADETFKVTLSGAGGGGVLGGPSVTTVTITDNDTGGVLALSASAYTVSEAAASATLTIKRTGGLASGVTVNYATGVGTATAGVDYTAKTGTVSLGAGVTSTTFTIPILPDTIDEPNETFTVTLSAPTGGATLGTPTTATVTITDNDAGGTIVFNPIAYTVSEAAGTANVKVTRTGGTASGVTVNYATANGTATSGTDYTTTSGTLSFGAGVTAMTIPIPILNDAVHESTESFTVSLSGPMGGAKLGTQITATVNITDNDP